MALTDNFFKKFNKKPELKPASEKDVPKSPDPDQQKEERSQKSFLEIIEDLAIRQKESLPDNYNRPKTDLSDISASDYPEVGSNETIARKIEELKSIISS